MQPSVTLTHAGYYKWGRYDYIYGNFEVIYNQWLNPQG